MQLSHACVGVFLCVTALMSVPFVCPYSFVRACVQAREMRRDRWEEGDKVERKELTLGH